MRSMISYFGYIETPGEKDQVPSGVPRWDGDHDLGANLSPRCPECQLRILLGQSLAVAYYLKFYGARCHEVINDFIEELNTDICYRFSRSCGKKFTDNYQKIYTILLNLVKFNRGGNWSDVDIGLVSEFLFDGGQTRFYEPIAWDLEEGLGKRVLIPWLMWMNRGVQQGYSEFVGEKKLGVATFFIDDCVYNTSQLSGMMSVKLRFHSIGVSFSTERTTVDELRSCPLLGYLSHFMWTGCTFETMVGIMSNFCMHTDIERQGLSMAHHMAYCLRQGVLFPNFNVAGDHTGIEPIRSRYHSDLFNALLAFTQFCTSARGLTMVDKNIVAKSFGCFAYTKEQKDSVAYLKKEDAAPSADELKAFKQVMGSCESLQLISQSPSLISASADGVVTGSTEDTKTGDGDGGNKTDDKGDGKDNKEPDKKDGDGDNKGKDEGDDSDPTDDDDGADDFDPDDDTPDDLSEFNADDVGGDGDSGGSSDLGSSSGDDNSPSTETGGTPDQVNTSDAQGIDFTITPPEMATVDSVLFREEMYKFLTNVLTNPPKCLTPQDIATLTALKRFWLSVLSIETIKGIVEACIRLPKSIQHSIHQSTELNK